MQEVLKIKKIKGKIISLDDYETLSRGGANHEFILYSDNILEGISLLNNLVDSNDKLLLFYAVVYEPIDQPIYVFKDKLNNFYSLKICGSFPNWNLPDDVHDLEAFVDIPDFAIYSISQKRTVVAGESTETASVGNSQWQREGRKIGSARNKVPFIYQTFYSGKDESLDSIREPTSLQVYNHLLYSIRYKIPSFVIYFDNNFEDGNTLRKRNSEDGRKIFIEYIKSILIVSVNDDLLEEKKEIERSIYKHMISYMAEGKAKSDGSIEDSPRLLKDFPIVNNTLKDILLGDSSVFISDLVEYVNNVEDGQEDFLNKYKFTEFNYDNKKDWTSYKNKKYVKDLIMYLANENEPAYSYAKLTKTGIAKTNKVIEYLKNNFGEKSEDIDRIFSDFDETVIMPLRIHKKSNGKLTFCPDPESGEIVAFAELFGYDLLGNKTRPVLGYCIVDSPDGFDLNNKEDTKLYKAIANYVDFLIIDGSNVYSNFNKHDNSSENYFPHDINSVKPKGHTEEVAIVSTFLDLSTIKADWDLCFIHTHHSSWQQLIVYKDKIARKLKINRNSSKVDLVMQRDEDLFFIAEGKKKYSDFFATAAEVSKIKLGMENTGDYINNLLNDDPNKVYSFICMVDAPEVHTEDFLKNSFNRIQESIKKGHLNEIVDDDFVVIAVYVIENKTLFKLFFSDSFNKKVRDDFIKVFKS